MCVCGTTGGLTVCALCCCPSGYFFIRWNIHIVIPCVCFSFGRLCFSKHILDLSVFLHKLNPDDELRKHLNCPSSKLSFSLQKPVSRAVPLRVVFLAGLTSLSTGLVHFFLPPSSQQWPWEVDIQSTHRCEHAHWYIHSTGVYIHTPIHRLMISIYTFFSLPFFPFSFPSLYLFFVSPSLYVCLSFSLFHPSTLYVSAVLSGSSCKTGRLIFLVWVRGKKSVAVVFDQQVDLLSRLSVFHCSCGLLEYETQSPTHLSMSNLNILQLIKSQVWHDVQNLTAGIKVALLLLRLRVSILYSVPDSRHFQWC